mmetsp:Transcript_14131/g.21568  ORF Transcript_14131/g.21568 Transcript_14131/m.21568 type:complete len:124 (-) Transcript_14131:736-1107(-)|eukprot:CAMPEP_0178927124 /NCGR_PEP_ID=MMETSP0786-20121207/18985_1 /TAXON_ID=186022 /ORGANISM="Thalassionema frauenfeldii, Strain CCMP 1798" /LENGTH=123 /DNA_ID=CAMNT_0020602465 /DNA_START=63 /DNA_END=434 /DNA_ORIENTATION=+
MYENSVKLIEMKDTGSVSVCVYNENDDLFALSERINAKFEEAYMNGYNWDALIRHFVGKRDPDLLKAVDTDPESGMFSAYINGYSKENVDKMKKFQAHIRKLLENEEELMDYISKHRQEIEWD